MKLTNEHMVALYNLENIELISLISLMTATLSARMNPTTPEDLIEDFVDGLPH